MSRIGWDASRTSAAALVVCLAGGALVVAGVAAPAHADVGPVNPVTVDLDGHPANSGFTVVVRGDVHLAADESEGTIALGGDLSFGTTYNIGTAPTPTFTVPGETNPVHLFVGGGIDWSSTAPGQILQILNQGFTKIGDPSTFAAFNKNPNDYQITAPGGAIDQTPRIEGIAAQSPASIAAPVPAGLVDIEGAFALYEQLSTDLATCPATVALIDDQGEPVTSPPSAPFRGHVRLQPNQTNVLSITADDLAALQELQFDDVPTQTSPLLINVSGDFSGTIPNSPGISGTAAHFILYNFADATTVTVTGGDSLQGTMYAPRAAVDWRRTNNLEGNLIAKSAIHGGPGAPVGVPREFHNRPFNALLECATSVPESTLTLRKVVQGGSAVPTDWTLSAVDGSTVVAGVSGSPEVTGTVTEPGDYVLSESGGPVGYQPGPWSCAGASAMNGDVVTLDAGQDAVCTVTNVFTGTTPTVPPEPAQPGASGLAVSGTDSTPAMLVAACAIGLGLWFRIGVRRSRASR